jgi:hypothetical protein
VEGGGSGNKGFSERLSSWEEFSQDDDAWFISERKATAMEFCKEDLPETPGTPETQRSEEKTNGDQKMVQPVSPIDQTPGSTQPTTHPPANANGSAGATETPNIGGGIFDPARWKTPIDARLDPKAPIKAAAFSKLEVRKPPADHYVHVHPDPDFNGVFPLYADSLVKRYEPYLIAPELMDTLPPQVKVNVKWVRLAVAVTDTGVLFLWHVAQTGSEFHESGDSCILTTMTVWRKVIPEGSGYRMETPEASLADPVFPGWRFEEYLMRAFKERYIDSLDHEIIKRLRGIR